MRAFTDTRTKETEDELWIVEHPPVFTQGVAGKPEHLLFNPSSIPIIKTDRGGQITYHGPGQAMLYVLFDLKRAGFGVRELVIRIENAVIATLAGYGIAAYGKRDAPGVYVSVESCRFPSPESGRGARGEGGEEAQHSLPKTRTVPEQLLTFARGLRKTNTDGEALIWRLLRNRTLANEKFRRQHPTRGDDPRYVLDFYCAEQKLGVELDGSQHHVQADYDQIRTAWFENQGIRVLRFWNNDVLLQTEAVLEAIYLALTPPPPSPLTPTPGANVRPSGSALAGEGSRALREREPYEAKIASLGLKIRNGCTYHGVAFNVDMDLTPFSFINACGFEGLRVTHLHELGVQAPLDAAGMALALELEQQLGAPAK